MKGIVLRIVSAMWLGLVLGPVAMVAPVQAQTDDEPGLKLEDCLIWVR